MKWFTNLMQLSIYLCSFSSTCFGLIRPSSVAMDVNNFFTYAAYGVLGVAMCRSWGVCVHTHSPGPTPSYTKDTICCICKEIVNIHCSWRWAYKPETCRAERTQINTQLHQSGKSFHISNQNQGKTTQWFTMFFYTFDAFRRYNVIQMNKSKSQFHSCNNSNNNNNYIRKISESFL